MSQETYKEKIFEMTCKGKQVYSQPRRRHCFVACRFLHQHCVLVDTARRTLGCCTLGELQLDCASLRNTQTSLAARRRSVVFQFQKAFRRWTTK